MRLASIACVHVENCSRNKHIIVHQGASLRCHVCFYSHCVISSKVKGNLYQVILAQMLTGVQRDIRCKVLAALSTVKQLEMELA